MAEIAMPMDDRQFNQSIAASRVATGAASEMFCAADLFVKGYLVSKPLRDGSRYDLIVDRDGVFYRIQVKTLSKSGQAPIGYIKYTEDTYGKGLQQRTIPKYQGHEFDILAVVDRETKEVYYIPVSEIDFSKPNVPVNAEARERFRAF